MSLADLPLLFLEQLLTETDALSHTNLFHTCRRLRQVVASNVRLSQVFFLPIRPHHNAYTRLTAATRHCQKHHLQLSGTLSDESGSLESAKALIAHGVSTAEGGLLSGVQSLELNFLHLDALLPSWLSAVVPNLNQLALHGCVIILKDSAAEQLEAAPCTSRITKLTLGPQIVPALNSHAWARQLQHFTGLKHITIMNAGCCPHLFLECEPVRDRVTQLDLEGVLVDDRGLELLLAMPQLTHVSCLGFRLDKSHAESPCQWEEVTVAKVPETDELDMWPEGARGVIKVMPAAAIKRKNSLGRIAGPQLPE